MFCPNCGNQLSDDSKFCDACGASVVEEPVAQPVPEAQAEPQPEPIAEPEPVAEPQPQYQQPQYQQPQYQQPQYQQSQYQQPQYQQTQYQQPQYQQPQYQQPQYRPQPQYGYAPAIPGRGLGIAGMVLGIIGLVFAFICLGAAIDIAENYSYWYSPDLGDIMPFIIFSIFSILGVSLAGAGRHKGYRCGVSVAGIVTSTIGLALCFISIVIVLSA